ncbi:transposase [Actinomadura soli]|uniref:Transposase n=1 Tax=Actinomadura soli TaxID=2508997 RepID=A0A5C4J152_9ACTN|nr:RNA-guided endonuclease TnpB family protein [Actinomadura soli]TMQ90400.1 transposase [Actinomadura soli]
MSRTGLDEGPGAARYTYRVRLSGRAERALLREWDRCRWVWNQCVVESRAAWRAGERIGPAVLDRMLTGWRGSRGWLRAGACVPQQQIIRDFGRSRAKAIKDIGERLPMRRRAGMPNLKKRGVADLTLNYTRRGFRLRDGLLVLAGGIGVRVVWSRGLPAVPSSVRVYRDSLGHWYCSFVVPAQVEPLPATGRVIGVDWGVKELATTTSDAHDLPHPQHGKNASAELARYQRQMARRRTPKGTPGSKGYKRAARRAARQHRKVQRQRADTARKWAKRVMRDHDRVAVEDFRPRFLARSTMARKAADGAIGAAKRELIDMGRKHGRLVVLVDPRNTTTDCASCGARTKHALPLSERIYSCTRCGVSRPRDKNSAQVMLVRAGFVPAGADGVRPGSPPGSRAA